MKTIPILMAILALAVALRGAAAADRPWDVETRDDRLVIARFQQPVAEFVYRDPNLFRPYFANVQTLSGLKVTRNHPPQAGDAMDHDRMHPGIWLAFGDINGEDFWRNKGRIEHEQFTQEPTLKGERLEFATDAKLVSAEGQRLCRLTTQYSLIPQPEGWLLIWDATFHADERDLTFGDQEEMGFAARMATSLTEKSGGLITNSQGQKTAGKTWGQPAAWCDYSGPAGGITLVTSPANFRESWWHNRDYGVFVANPFGRAALKQGERSAVIIRQGESLRLCFAAMIHHGNGYDPTPAMDRVRPLLK